MILCAGKFVPRKLLPILTSEASSHYEEFPKTNPDAQHKQAPMIQPPPSRERFKAMVANAKASDKRVNSRISSLIKDVTDFLAENDRMKNEMTQERLALNSDAF